MTEDSTIGEALIQTAGNVSAAARVIGMSRRQVIRRIESSNELNELCEDLRETLIDEAEDCIANSIRNGDVNTAKWLLLSSKAGGNRGYSKNVNLNQPDDSPLIQTVEVVVDSPEQVRKILRYDEFEEMVDRANEQRILENLQRQE